MNENEKKDIKGISVGIDLGTTNSAISYADNDQTIVFENLSGNRTTPSFVYVDKEKSQSKVGIEAKRMASRSSKNVFSVFKRLIGMPYKDLKDLNVPYEVFSDSKGMASCKDAQGNECDPIFLSSRVLLYLKESAEKKLGMEIANAVITVPAYFNNSQREATIEAGKQAGLNVLKILNEPTAAALAVNDAESSNKDQTMLVYDFGGGTFDVSIIVYDANAKVYQVTATNGDTQLGGRDLDQQIFKKARARILRDTAIPVEKSGRAMYEVQEAVELAKKQLSQQEEATISVPYLGAEFKNSQGEPYILEMNITRTEFNDIAKSYIDKTLAIVDSTIKEAELSPDDLDKIVLVGGSTRIPLVQDLLKKKFGESKISMKHNPDEVVAIGASIEAAIRSGKSLKDVSLLDVTPLPIGIETLGGAFTPIIDKNKAYPVSQSQVFSTAEDNQTSVLIKV
jgi:molecular chaperone DnaK